MKSIGLIFLVGVVLSGGVAKEAKHTKVLTADEGLEAQSEVPLQIGYGIDSRTSMPRIANCFSNAGDPKNIKYRNFAQQLSFDKSLSTADLSTMTNVEIGAKVPWGWFSVSANARYVKETFDTKYSMNFNYGQTFSADAIYEIPSSFGLDLLSEQGKQAYKLGHAKFVEYCGDSFVSSGKAGAALMVTVGLNFRTFGDKYRFETSAKVKIAGIASISAAFKYATTELKIEAGLTIRAIQFGGNTTSLGRIFGQPDTKGNYAIAACGPSDLDSCSLIISNIITYAQKDFTTSVDVSKPETLYNFASHSEPYQSYGINLEVPALSPSLLEAQSYAFSTFKEKQNALSFLKGYSSLPTFSYWDEKDLGYFKRVLAEHETAVSLFQSSPILRACFDKRMNEECVPVINALKGQLQYMDNKLVPKLRNIFIGQAGDENIITLIPAKNNIVFQENSNKVYGTFFIYFLAGNLFNLSGACKVDMNEKPVFDELDPGFNVQCSNKEGTGNALGPNFWVRRVFFTPPEGVAGLVGWNNYIKPVPPKGYNTIFIRRSDWESIPI